MNKKEKSEAALKIDWLTEQLIKKHQEFFDKVGKKRLCDFTWEEMGYFVNVLLPEMGENAAKSKEEEKK